ncbi:HXXEE domain-containing protein [Enemella evansiae]|nr:HXXEE domain-containing protein [Enemella evansiae]OYO03662.1 HXXEE domain-containing protein [Enemella evansiae]
MSHTHAHRAASHAEPAEQWLACRDDRAHPWVSRWSPVPTPPVPDQLQVNVAVAAMGTVVAAAAVQGVRTGGRSQFFQDSLWAFGMRGFGHLALSALTRGYTTGVLTAPTVVIPFWWWATRTLETAGATQRPRHGRAVALLLGALVGAHTLGQLASRSRLGWAGARG